MDMDMYSINILLLCVLSYFDGIINQFIQIKMRIGDKIVHNGIEAVLVKGDRSSCKGCFFSSYLNEDCAEVGLLNKCLAKTRNDDDGIFKKVEEEKK